MTRLKLFSAALILSAAMATPVFAQAVIGAPGDRDFFNPDGDILHGGGGQAPPAPNAIQTIPPRAMAMMPPGDGKLVRHPVSPPIVARRADRYDGR
jgi:hypothetical protein